MSGVELATAFVTIASSAKGLGSSITSELAGVDKEAAEKGKSSGGAFSNMFSGGLGKLGELAGVASVGGAVIGIGTGLLEIGKTFDGVSRGIQEQTGLSGAALTGMVDVVKQVGADVPDSFEEVGKTVSGLQQRLGLSGDTMKTVATQYLEAGRMLGTTVDINTTTAAFSAFGIKGKDVSGAMDTLFKTAQTSGVGMNALAATVQAAAPAMTDLGFTFAQTTSLAGNLDKAGVDSTATLAAMSRGLVNVAKSGKDPQKVLAATTTQVEALVKSGNTAGALKVASTIFGTRGAVQFVNAVKSGKLAVGDLTAAGGENQKGIIEAGEATLSLSDKFAKLKNKATAALQPVGKAIMDGLGGAMTWATNMITVGSEKIGPIMQKIGAVVGPIFKNIVAAIKPIMAEIGPIFQKIITVAEPILKILMSVVGTAFKYISGAIGAAMSIIEGIIEIFTGLITGNWGAAWKGIQDIFKGIWDQIKNIISTALALIGDLLKLAWNAIKNLITVVWTVIKTLFGKLWEGIVSAFMVPVNFIKKLLADAWNAIKLVVSTVWNAIKGVFTSIWSGIKAVINTVIGWIKSFLQTEFNGIKNIVNSIWTGIKDVVVKPLQAAWDWISNVFSTVKKTISDIWNSVIGTVNTVWSTVTDAIKKPFQAAWDWISNVFATIKKTVSDIWNDIINTAGSILGGIGKVASDAFGGIGDAVKSALNGIITAINDTVIGGINLVIKGANDVNPFSDIPQIPNIPTFAAGGVVAPSAGGTIVRVAEKGQAEIIAPEPLLRSTMLDALHQAGNRGPLIGTVVQQPGQDSWQLAADLDRRMAFMGGR